MKNFLLLFFAMLCFGTSSGQWQQLNNVPFNTHHGVGFAHEGQGYVLSGGLNGGFASRIFYKYDPASDSWENLGDYPGPARGYSIGKMWEGKLYFGMGISENFTGLNDFWVYDVDANEFTELPECPCIGRSHPAFEIVDGIVYMGMGGGPAGDLGDWWSYNIDTQEWTQLADNPTNRHHPYQFEIDGQIYVGSGHFADWNRYDPASNFWFPVAPLDTRVAGTQFAFNGKGYALSGTDTFHDNLPTGEFWEYDPVENTWTAIEEHPGGSRWAPASFIIDDMLYFFGGWATIEQEEFHMLSYPLGDPPSSANDLPNAEPITVHPNPATDEVYLDLSRRAGTDYQLTIFNLMGQQVSSMDFKNNTVDVSSLVKGTYLFEVRGEEQIFIAKVVKQ